jgi:hypothetical protein
VGSGFRRFGRNRFFFNDCFGFFPCRSPFFGSSIFIGAPFYGGFYPGYPAFYPDYYYPPPPPDAYYNDGSNDVALESAVRSLAEQVDDLREERREAQRDEQRDARRADQNDDPRSKPYYATPAPGSSTSAGNASGSAVFVFRDGRRLTAQNYAISGQTLWIFNEHAAKRYSMADLDRAATEKANEANGVELKLP